MFLLNKWRNISIKNKIFISTSMVIIISFLILYMCIYIFMPRVYYNYETDKIYKSIEKLKKELAENEELELELLLDEFAYKNNIDLVIVKDLEVEKNSEISVIYSSFRDGYKNPKMLVFLQENIPYLIEFQKRKNNDQFKLVTNEASKMYNEKGNNALNIIEKLYIKEIDTEALMITHAAVSPIDQANTIVALFTPFAIIAVIAIAVTIGVFYSIIISNPLIRISKVTKKMSELDFDNIIEIQGNDEIGQLSSSINHMNKNLKESFAELEMVNSKLTKEIEMERRLEKERREFIATISHELKSPITIISGQLEGMIYNIGKYKNRDVYLKESFNVIQNMRELVREILQLSERENIDFKYNFQEINISNLLKDTLSDLEYFIEEKKLNVQYNISNNIKINVDEKLFKKVISNVVKNAITYSPENEYLIINLDENKFTVENTGVSISNRDLKEIFNAFYRVDKSRNRKTGGTGLGLYIVKTILDKHKNITYAIESRENSVIFKIEFNE